MAIGVYVVSDHQLQVWAITRLIETEPSKFRLVGSADAVTPAVLETIIASAPQIVLLDLDGHSAAVVGWVQALRAAVPGVTSLLMTRQDDSVLQDRAIIAGARGVLGKTIGPQQILVALEKVTQGQIWLDHLATGRIFVELSRMGSRPERNDKLASLTEREQQIVSCLVANVGAPGKTIAYKLHISESTLRNHLTSIYEKLGVLNRHGLLAYAFENGLVKSNPGL